MLVNERDLQVELSNSSLAPAPEVASPLTIKRKRNPNVLSYVPLILYLAVVALWSRPTWEESAWLAGYIALGIVIGIVLTRLVTFFAPLMKGYRNPGLTPFVTLSSEGLEWHQGKSATGKDVIAWSTLRLIGIYKPVWQTPGWLRSLDQARTKTLLIVLNFADKPDYYIDLHKLSVAERDHFFRIISRCVPQRLLAPEVLFMQVQCLYGNSPSTEGFTQIWSEEFDRRFELANHVSLPAGHSCGSGQYTIEMTIATRMSASTYLASDRTGRRVVIKELVMPVESNEAMQQKLHEQFEREARLLASLDHKSIVSVRDHFVENDRNYLVMDCVPGNNLRQHVRLHGPFGEKQALSIARQLAEVLVYLHNQDPPVIHRDLTPDNIIYCDKTDEVKVVDFGAANIFQSKGTGTLIGKQGYMPPEQFKGKATPASDVYALGSTLLFMLSGNDPQGMGRMNVSEIPTTSPLLCEFIKSCLQLDQESRPSIANVVEQITLLSATPGEEP